MDDTHTHSHNLKAVIEALLFVSEHPLTVEHIRGALEHLDAKEVVSLVEELNTDYEQNNRGLRVTAVAGGFQLVTAPAVLPFLKKLYRSRNVERLSKPSLETLAIIAYKQPLTKLEIETLRNVNVDGVIQTLLSKELIRVAGRKNAPGLPKVYATTRQFLEYFGLRSLEELPKKEDIATFLANKDKDHVIGEPAQTN
jgi:segregation and condensation protein B